MADGQVTGDAQEESGTASSQNGPDVSEGTEDRSDAYGKGASEGDSASGSQDSSADTPPAKKKRTFWEEARVPVVAAIVGSLALTIAPPLRNWCLGVADYAKDTVVAVLDYDEHLVDNLKERIDHRPGWTSDPTFLDGSVDYLNDHIGVTSPNLTEFGDGLRPTVVSVDDLIERGVEFDGVPVVLVARVLSSTTLSSDAFADVPDEELTVRGGDPRHILTLGAGGRVGNDVFSRPGEVAIVQGILTATGRIDDPYSDEEIDSGYFTVLSIPNVSSRDPLIRSAVRELEKRT